MVNGSDRDITFVVYSKYGADDIRDKIGVAEYSYYFVLKSFLPILSKFGHVVIFSARDNVAAWLKEHESSQGRHVVVLSFTPPHSMPVLEDCTSVPVFAWEYDTLPSENWGGEIHDWIAALRSSGCAVTHSRYSQRVVKKALGRNYPIFSIPSPVWSGMRSACVQNLRSISYKRFSLQFTGVLMDSFAVDFNRLDEDFWRNYNGELDAEPADAAGRRKGDVCQEAMPGFPQVLSVSGVVYTSIFNPFDGRKNWQAMLTAFCYAHRNNRRATLIMKISANHYAAFTDAAIDMLRRLGPIKCRVIAIYGFLEDEEYRKLVTGTSYYVNTSFGEGQCIPLMEFLSAGVPAIAPRATAMSDYIRRYHSLVVNTHVEPSSWQHDPRDKFRCMHHRVDWWSLKRAYRISYSLAMPLGFPLYKVMQLLAVLTMYRHCSVHACSKTFKKLVDHLKRGPGRDKKI